MTFDATVFIVDDDADVRDSLQALVESAGYIARAFPSAMDFLATATADSVGCLIADIRMPDMDGLELQAELNRRGVSLPVIIVTGHGDVPLAVKAMRGGAIDFIEKPYDDDILLNSLERGLRMHSERLSKAGEAQAAQDYINLLSPREKEVLQHLVAGRPNKIVAHELGISARTVEVHRARIMEKMNAKSLSDLVRVALAAGLSS